MPEAGCFLVDKQNTVLQHYGCFTGVGVSVAPAVHGSGKLDVSALAVLDPCVDAGLRQGSLLLFTKTCLIMS